MDNVGEEFYQFVLSAVYHSDGLWGDATFDLYARALPEHYGYLVFCGLEPLLERLLSFEVGDSVVERLRAHPAFTHVAPGFFEHLRRLRFSGEVWAMPEGTVFFPNEPVLRVTAPLEVCTLIETLAIQTIAPSTAVATRAARLCAAANWKTVLDFGSRRSPGSAAAWLAARAAYVGGVAGTTNAEAVLGLGIPPVATMSDTFLAAYGNDRLAMDAFRMYFPELCHFTLPDDEPEAGVASLQKFRAEVKMVRLDHMDLGHSAPLVRAALDRQGMRQAKIMGSGHLDEHRIAALLAQGAPIDVFAVGRSLALGEDPGMRMAFRIAERAVGAENRPVTRQGSAPLPGRKQVIRFADHDLLCLEHEVWAQERLGGVPMLRPVLRDQQRIDPSPPLARTRDFCISQLRALPPGLRRIQSPDARHIAVSDELARITALGG